MKTAYLIFCHLYNHNRMQHCNTTILIVMPVLVHRQAILPKLFIGSSSYRQTRRAGHGRARAGEWGAPRETGKPQELSCFFSPLASFSGVLQCSFHTLFSPFSAPFPVLRTQGDDVAPLSLPFWDQVCPLTHAHTYWARHVQAWEGTIPQI